MTEERSLETILQALRRRFAGSEAPEQCEAPGSPATAPATEPSSGASKEEPDER